MPAKKKPAGKNSQSTSRSQPVSPRTPHTENEAASFKADSSGDTAPRVANKVAETVRSSERKSAAPKKASKNDLRVFEVIHDGFDTRGRSLVVAESEGRARQLVGDELIKLDLGHTHGLMTVQEVPSEDVPARISGDQEGAVVVDNGKR